MACDSLYKAIKIDRFNDVTIRSAEITGGDIFYFIRGCKNHHRNGPSAHIRPPCFVNMVPVTNKDGNCTHWVSI